MTEWRHGVIWSLFTPILPKAHYTGSKTLVPLSLYWERERLCWYVLVKNEMNREIVSRKRLGEEKRMNTSISVTSLPLWDGLKMGEVCQNVENERAMMHFLRPYRSSRKMHLQLFIISDETWQFSSFGSDQGSDASLLLPPNTCRILCNSRCL